MGPIEDTSNILLRKRNPPPSFNRGKVSRINSPPDPFFHIFKRYRLHPNTCSVKLFLFTLCSWTTLLVFIWKTEEFVPPSHSLLCFSWYLQLYFSKFFFLLQTYPLLSQEAKLTFTIACIKADSLPIYTLPITNTFLFVTRVSTIRKSNRSLDFLFSIIMLIMRSKASTTWRTRKRKVR